MLTDGRLFVNLTWRRLEKLTTVRKPMIEAMNIQSCLTTRACWTALSAMSARVGGAAAETYSGTKSDIVARMGAMEPRRDVWIDIGSNKTTRFY